MLDFGRRYFTFYYIYRNRSPVPDPFPNIFQKYYIREMRREREISKILFTDHQISENYRHPSGLMTVSRDSLMMAGR